MEKCWITHLLGLWGNSHSHAILTQTPVLPAASSLISKWNLNFRDATRARGWYCQKHRLWIIKNNKCNEKNANQPKCVWGWIISNRLVQSIIWNLITLTPCGWARASNSSEYTGLRGWKQQRTLVLLNGWNWGMDVWCSFLLKGSYMLPRLFHMTTIHMTRSRARVCRLVYEMVKSNKVDGLPIWTTFSFFFFFLLESLSAKVTVGYTCTFKTHFNNVKKL